MWIIVLNKNIMFLVNKTTQLKSNNFDNIKPVYFEDAQVDHCYAPFEVTVEK